MFIQRIIKEKSEELNSPFGNMAFCKIKFHKGVEFNFASEVILMVNFATGMPLKFREN